MHFTRLIPNYWTQWLSYTDDKDTRNATTEMIGQNGLNCIACHTFQNKGQGAMPALDLTVMAERLQPGWFYQYMLSHDHFPKYRDAVILARR